MTNTEEKILEVFKKHKTPIDGILKPQSISVQSWDRRSQDEFQGALQNLMINEYISMKDSWYVLTEKGYNYIYRNYTIEETKNLILGIFRKHKIGVGEILMKNHFITLQQNADRFHFDNFSTGMQQLISEEKIEFSENRYYKLTQSGYDRIY